ncbi:MAG: ParA family protein [Lachnospiraceae bacterium]|nr:ParA family protein [Lachnospiraceae bacterium]
MCKVYAVASQKGGVAKTTTAENLGIGLVRKGFRVLLIDSDAQGSLTSSLGYTQPDNMEITLSTILEKEVNDEVYDRTSFGILHHEEGIDLIPCNIELSGLEVSFINVWNRERILNGYVEKLRKHYDFIIIDSGPSLGLMTINVLAASDRVIIPVQAAFLSIKGLEQLIRTIGRVKKGLNPRLGIEGILITMLDERTNFAKGVMEILGEKFGSYINIFKNRIPFSVKVAESSAEGVSIYRHDPKGKVAAAYTGFSEEVLANV